jgi:hypothetical protein
VKHWNSGIAIFDAMGRGEGGKGTVAVVGPLEGVRRGAVVAIYRVGGRRCGCGGKMGPACGLGGKVGIYVCEERKGKGEMIYRNNIDDEFCIDDEGRMSALRLAVDMAVHVRLVCRIDYIC